MKTLIYTIILALIFSFMIGCRAKTIYVPVEIIKTEYKNKYIRDSIQVYDSIHIKEKGDTVIIEKYKYVYKDRFRTDTILKTDSIQIPYPVKGDDVPYYPKWIVVLAVIGGVGIGYLGFRIIRFFT